MRYGDTFFEGHLWSPAEYSALTMFIVPLLVGSLPSEVAQLARGTVKALMPLPELYMG